MVPLPSTFYSPAILSFSVPLTLLGCLLSHEFAFSQTLHFPGFPPHLFSFILFRWPVLYVCVAGMDPGPDTLGTPSPALPSCSLPPHHLPAPLSPQSGQTLAWLRIKPHCLYQLDRPRTGKQRTKPQETQPKPVRKDRDLTSLCADGHSRQANTLRCLCRPVRRGMAVITDAYDNDSRLGREPDPPAPGGIE